MKEKKKKFISLIKMSTLLLLFGLFIACTNEEFIDKLENSNNYKKTKVNLEELKKLKPKAANKISGIKNKSINERIIHDNLNHFSFDTDNMLLIENGNKYWLTTRIIRDTLVENSLTENLVLSPLTNGTFAPFIIQYNLNETEKNLIANDLPVTNLLSKMRISSIDNYDNTIYNNISNKVLFDGGGDYSGTVFLFPDGNCYVIDQIWTTSEGFPDWNYVQVNCPTNTGGSGDSDDSGDSGSTSGGSVTVYGDNNGGSSTNNDGSTDGYSSSSSGNAVTSPLIEESGAGNGPCEELKKLATKNVTSPTISGNIITLLNHIKSKTVPQDSEFHQNGEAGFSVFSSDNTNNDFTAEYFTTPAGSEGTENILAMLGLNNLAYLMHTHGLMHYSCFSLDDIYATYKLLISTNMGYPIINNTDNFTSFLVTAHGVNYAMKITDKQAFINWGNEFFQNWGVLYYRGILNDKYFQNMKVKSNINVNETEVARFFKNNGDGMGIELYKNDGDFTTWKKISIDSNGNKVEKSCK